MTPVGLPLIVLFIKKNIQTVSMIKKMNNASMDLGNMLVHPKLILYLTLMSFARNPADNMKKM